MEQWQVLLVVAGGVVTVPLSVLGMMKVALNGTKEAIRRIDISVQRIDGSVAEMQKDHAVTRDRVGRIEGILLPGKVPTKIR